MSDFYKNIIAPQTTYDFKEIMGNFEVVKFPMLRNLGKLPKLIAEDIVSVQPMTRPIGKKFPIYYNKETKTIEQVDIEFFTEEEFNL